MLDTPVPMKDAMHFRIGFLHLATRTAFPTWLALPSTRYCPDDVQYACSLGRQACLL